MFKDLPLFFFFILPFYGIQWRHKEHFWIYLDMEGITTINVRLSSKVLCTNLLVRKWNGKVVFLHYCNNVSCTPKCNCFDRNVKNNKIMAKSFVDFNSFAIKAAEKQEIQ